MKNWAWPLAREAPKYLGSSLIFLQRPCCFLSVSGASCWFLPRSVPGVYCTFIHTFVMMHLTNTSTVILSSLIHPVFRPFSVHCFYCTLVHAFVMMYFTRTKWNEINLCIFTLTIAWTCCEAVANFFQQKVFVRRWKKATSSIGAWTLLGSRQIRNTSGTVCLFRCDSRTSNLDSSSDF